MPPMLYMPGTASWDDAASAVGKDCHSSRLSFKLGSLFAFYLLKEEAFLFHINGFHIRLPYFQPVQ